MTDAADGTEDEENEATAATAAAATQMHLREFSLRVGGRGDETFGRNCLPGQAYRRLHTFLCTVRGTRFARVSSCIDSIACLQTNRKALQDEEELIPLRWSDGGTMEHTIKVVSIPSSSIAPLHYTQCNRL